MYKSLIMQPRKLNIELNLSEKNTMQNKIFFPLKKKNKPSETFPNTP